MLSHDGIIKVMKKATAYLGLLMVLTCLNANSIWANERPNFLVIITNDQSIDTINAFGNDAISTPNINRLAESGMARSHRYKLIYYPMLKKNVLFDLQNDPWELTDISQNESSDKIIAELSNKLEEMKKEVGDPLTNDDPIGSYKPFMLKVEKQKQMSALKISSM